MSNKVETTIAYRLDARGLRDAKRELEKSFKPETVKALNAALKDARSRVKDLSGEYARAAKAQGAMANWPKALRDNLKAARDEVGKLTDDLKKQADAERKLLEIHEKEAKLARENRGTAFRQGLFQGFGGPAASYLQRRENATTQEQRDELRAQFMGQIAGGAGRRVMGAGRSGMNMASGMVGGGGPLGTMLGNIPFLGGAAQLAEGAVGSFVQRQQAQLGAFAIGGSDITRAGRTISGRAATPAIPAVYDLPRDGVLEAPGAREQRVQAKVREALERHGLAGRGDRIDREGNITEDPEVRTLRTAVEAGARRGELKKMGAVLRPGTGIPGTDAVADQIIDERRATDDMRAATRGLLTGTDSIQAGTAFTKQVGGRYNNGQFAQAFAAETQFGVDQGISAQLFRQQRSGRGGATKDSVNMLAKAIGAATAQGLEGSEIGEYLDTIAQVQAQSEQKGLKIDTDTFTGLGVALSRGLGLEGPQAGRIASNLTSMAQNVVTQGAKGPMDIQMLRAAGFDPSKGNFLETRRKLAGGMDASSTFDLLESLVGGEGDALKRGYTLERSGLGLGTEQAIALQEQLKMGKRAFMESAGGGTGTAADLIAGMAMKDSKGNSTTLGKLTGAVRGANAVQDQLVAAGGASASNVQALQQQAASLATTLATQLNGPLTAVTGGVTTISKGIETLLMKINEWMSNNGGSSQ